MGHTFHIPVLGLGYSIDTALKVARYGISSVLSIVDDELIERMRKFHSPDDQIYIPIKKTDDDYRAKRITAYLNLLDKLIEKQLNELKAQPFLSGTDITRYFELLPETSANKQFYQKMLFEADLEEKILMQRVLRENIKKGAIDVNIMSKVDKINYAKTGAALEDRFSDALASLRGFANSTLNASVVLSAGMNPRLYSYLEEFDDFFPVNGSPSEKTIILKVSDFRSAFIQAKFLAKKGLWVHEFRIESGLNCGGHAFATEGYLLGPILEEFKQKRSEMIAELHTGYIAALANKNIITEQMPETRITVQGGIGTEEEDRFLRKYYQLDGTGWGSPFLLVPEATNVDTETLRQLADSDEDDFYISGASPIGIPFNNFRNSSGEKQRIARIESGNPGSPCTKKFLVSNTEFTDKPVCTASREYQNLKIKQLQEMHLPAEQYKENFEKITEKVCLCQGLCSSVYIKDGILKPRENHAVTICPGPNTAYFSGIYSLDEMVRHIYGRVNLLKNVNRPHLFSKELKLYISYLQKDIEENISELTEKKIKQLQRFKDQLLQGVDYYTNLLNEVPYLAKMIGADLNACKQQINKIEVPVFT